jgi:hypothetical protein
VRRTLGRGDYMGLDTEGRAAMDEWMAANLGELDGRVIELGVNTDSILVRVVVYAQRADGKRYIEEGPDGPRPAQSEHLRPIVTPFPIGLFAAKSEPLRFCASAA